MGPECIFFICVHIKGDGARLEVSSRILVWRLVYFRLEQKEREMALKGGGKNGTDGKW